MYAEDGPLIAAYAKESPQGLFRVGLFVQATMNTHCEFVPNIIDSFDTFGFGTRYLMFNVGYGYDCNPVQSAYNDKVSLT